MNLLLKLITYNKSHRWRKTALATARECTYHSHQYVKWWAAQSSSFSDRDVSSEAFTSMSTSISVSADSLLSKSSFGWADPSSFHPKKKKKKEEQMSKYIKAQSLYHRSSPITFGTVLWWCNKCRKIVTNLKSPNQLKSNNEILHIEQSLILILKLIYIYIYISHTISMKKCSLLRPHCHG